MSEHVTDWLNAYHDGELRGMGLQRVESHLTACAECRVALEELRALSALLRQTPPEAVFPSAEHFAARLALRLPRRAGLVPARNAWLELGGWLATLGALAVWLFLNITVWVRSAFLLALDAGLLANLPGLQPLPLQMNWVAALTFVWGDQLGLPGQLVLSLLNDVHLFVIRSQGMLFSELLLMLLYLGGLALWWLRQSKSSFSA
ncbi:MAG: zf-HC2 domain-containing protein [Anaerolineales bacterium]|nr:zf-HC2 domain-containing protein [Anaerolineales bacterium]